MGSQTSDRAYNLAASPNASLYQRTSRLIDQELPHQDLMPQVQPPTLLKTNQLKISDLFPGLGAKANQLAPKPNAFGQQTLKQPGQIAGQVAQGFSTVADLAGDTLDSFKKQGPVNTWGFEAQTAGGNRNTIASSALKSAGKGAAVGASIGSIIPGWGTAVGAAVGGLVGGITGLLKGKKKVKTEAKDYKDNTQMAYESYHQKANAQQYAALAKYGAKISIKKKLDASKKNAISRKGRPFKLGGKLNTVGKVNIIPSGTLHKENNNLGQKDKGIPVIDGEGNKIYEVEREELILRLKTTQAVEDYVAKYKKSNNAKHLIDLGKLLTKEIMTNTHDFSGRYGLEVE